MKSYKADMHLHTVLSPCGSLEMSPRNIVQQALARGLDMIAVTDHNSTRQCQSVQQVAGDRGLNVLCGVEVTTREEVHCLAYFHSWGPLREFDRLLYDHLADISNEPERFGYQVVVDETDQILDQPGKLLISAVDMSIGEVEKRVHELGGLFVPAHIDRMRNGIIAQLGFVPPDLRCDALEISRHSSMQELLSRYPDLEGYTFLRGSDAHFPDEVGAGYTEFHLEALTWDEICMAMQGLNQRKMQVR